MLERKAIARQLTEAARLLDVLNEDPFRSRAYANAARALEAYDGDLAELADQGELTRIKGIGKGLASEIVAEPVDGVLPLLADLRSRVPAGVRDLFRVSGLGASKVRALWQAGITSLEALVAAVEAGEVQQLKGFGKTSAASFAEGARFALAARARVRRDQAEAALVELGWALEEALPGAAPTVVGEFRRGLETVGEVELVIGGVALDALVPVARRVLDDVSVHAADPHGGARLEGSYQGVPVRWFPVPREAAGAAIAVRTGGDAFVAWLRDRAAAQGATLSGDGLGRDDERIATPTEADLFAALELPHVAPELREAPDPTPVDDLIARTDIRGVVHNHSTWSDAEHSLREMVAAARAKGFRYLAMADHSRTSYYAGGLTEDRVRRQSDEIRAIRAELADEGAEFDLLHGIEVDILPDGSLDYDDEILALLDYAVVSVHQQFTLSRAEQTARIVAAVQNPYADILGHPTGRLLLQRPEYDVDLDAVIDACAATGTVIEINANPRRLDLDWRWAKVAKERGCAFAIDPDAHHVDGFDDLRYGVAVARKAGLTAGDVVTAEPTGAAFLARLKRSAKPG